MSDRVKLPKLRWDELEIGDLRVGNEIDNTSKLEVGIEHDYTGSLYDSRDTSYEFLSLEEVVIYRDHLTKLIDQAKGVTDS